jgi:hypothetical protein
MFFQARLLSTHDQIFQLQWTAADVSQWNSQTGASRRPIRPWTVVDVICQRADDIESYVEPWALYSIIAQAGGTGT